MILVSTACLIAAPATCDRFEVPIEARLPMECVGAMHDWANEHPAWRVTRWGCGRREHSA